MNEWKQKTGCDLILRDITDQMERVLEVRKFPHGTHEGSEQLLRDYFCMFRGGGAPETDALSVQNRMKGYFNYLQMHEVGDYRQFEPESEESADGLLLFERDGEELQVPFELADFI